ncbi:hypothetical protein DCF50_p43 [Dehalobacter sp. CF]|nr:hypothetical protein DCF50_p43 [Dehalobacter sp. CF]
MQIALQIVPIMRKIQTRQTRANTSALMSATLKPYRENFSFQKGSILILQAGSKRTM